MRLTIDKDTAAGPFGPLDTPEHIAAGLAALLDLDPRLAAVAAATGPLPLRRLPAGFGGLARVVVGQQVSTASAAAIWGRLAAAGGDAPAGFAGLDDAALRAVGLSAAKVRTLRGLAAACADGLDLAHLAGLTAADAHARLVALPGIGPWTADSYLLFCVGHPDVFPAGDIALQAAVAGGLGLGARPSAKALAMIAADWSPWRAVAARLFWAYYRTLRPARDGLPV